MKRFILFPLNVGLKGNKFIVESSLKIIAKAFIEMLTIVLKKLNKISKRVYISNLRKIKSKI